MLLHPRRSAVSAPSAAPPHPRSRRPQALPVHSWPLQTAANISRLACKASSQSQSASSAAQQTSCCLTQSACCLSTRLPTDLFMFRHRQPCGQPDAVIRADRCHSSAYLFRAVFQRDRTPQHGSAPGWPPAHSVQSPLPTEAPAWAAGLVQQPHKPRAQTGLLWHSPAAPTPVCRHQPKPALRTGQRWWL